MAAPIVDPYGAAYGGPCGDTGGSHGDPYGGTCSEP